MTQIKMVFDLHRGTRRTTAYDQRSINSNDVLSPLTSGSPNRRNVDVSYYSPNYFKMPPNAPSSLNMLGEAMGTYHTKFLVFDNNVILTGANLSEEYFLDRKDRYMLINDCAELADYLQEFLECVAESGDSFDEAEEAGSAPAKYGMDMSSLSNYFEVFGRASGRDGQSD